MSELPFEIPEWGLPTALLAGQLALAIAIIELLRRRVFVALERIESPELVLDVWGPMILVFPLLFFAGRVETDVRGSGWMISGAPVMCALYAAGAALIVNSFQFSPPINSEQRLGFAVWGGWNAWVCGGTGLVFLMLGAAHELTLWMGQCAFAAGAVVMWMNTPELHRVRRDNRFPTARKEESAVGAATTAALLCAIAQGVLSIWIDDDFAKISAGLLLAQCAVVTAWAARISGANAALRLGGWSAAYGVLLGLGTLSILEMVPKAWQIVSTGETSRITKLANGFGAYAPEAMMLITFAAFVALWHRIDAVMARDHRRIVGFTLIALAAGLTAWRVTRV